MAIPAQFNNRYAYHFTSIQNLPSIIGTGILSTNLKNRQNISHVNVAHASIQNRRSTMEVPQSGGRVVHDYVPFYFAQRTPMQLAVLNKKNVDQELIIYFAVPISIIDRRQGVYFTDAAANTAVPPNFFNDQQSAHLSDLRWDLIDQWRWQYPIDSERQHKMAELLIPDTVAMGELSHIVAWDESYAQYVRTIFARAGVPAPRVFLGAPHYFRDPHTQESIVTGPILLKQAFENAVQSAQRSPIGVKKFANITVAVEAVRRNFGSIDELDGIDGLRANYGPHRDDVGTHSRRVAAAVVNSPEYAALSTHNKAILEMGALLHDIGKGPKSRWGNDFMDKPDANHAKRSLPMLQRILTQDIGGLDPDSIRRLMMLVTFDDLPGDIVANERDEQQLYNIITSEDDINMLVALSKADIGSLDNCWLENVSTPIDEMRLRVLNQLRR